MRGATGPDRDGCLAASSVHCAIIPECPGDGGDRIRRAVVLSAAAGHAADDLPAASLGFLAIVPAGRHSHVHLRRGDHEPCRHHDPPVESGGDTGRPHVGRVGSDQRAAGGADGVRIGIRQRGRGDAVQDARDRNDPTGLSAPFRRGHRRRFGSHHADDAARPGLRAVRLPGECLGRTAVHGGHHTRLHHDDRVDDHHTLPVEALWLPSGAGPSGISVGHPGGDPPCGLGADYPSW